MKKIVFNQVKYGERRKGITMKPLSTHIPHIQNSLQQKFEDLFEITQNYLSENDEIPISIIRYEMEGFLNSQVWHVSFQGTKVYENKKIEGLSYVNLGLLIFPCDFPTRAPEFYFGYFIETGLPPQHDNIYGNGLLCIPLLIKWKSTEAYIILTTIREIFNNPNKDNPANFNFVSLPQPEKHRIMLEQQSMFQAWDS